MGEADRRVTLSSPSQFFPFSSSVLPKVKRRNGGWNEEEKVEERKDESDGGALVGRVESWRLYNGSVGGGNDGYSKGGMMKV